jgi:hypothetical protein
MIVMSIVVGGQVFANEDRKLSTTNRASQTKTARSR